MNQKLDEGVSKKEFEELKLNYINLEKKFNDLFRKNIITNNNMSILERKLRQMVKNVENKIPRR